MSWPTVCGEVEEADCCAGAAVEEFSGQVPGYGGRRRRGRGARRRRTQIGFDKTWEDGHEGPRVATPTGSDSAATAPAQVGLQQVEAPAETLPEEDPLAQVHDDAEAALAIIKRLEDPDTRRSTLTWLLKAARPLALSKQGCRVVQKFIDYADAEHQSKLLDELAPHTVDLYESPNGNHVLTKVIEVLPAARLGAIVRKLEEKGFEEVAKHRYGCRVLERLIEHCPESELKPLIFEVLSNTEALSRHPFGNFVISHLFEHAPTYYKHLLNYILHQIPQLAMHRTASHVVQKALAYGDQEDKQNIVRALLWAEGDLALNQVARGRYGSFVVEQLSELSPELVADVQHHLGASMPELGQCSFGRRVAEKFGFELPELPKFS